MKKFLALTAAAALLNFVGTAHAATDITLGATSSDIFFGGNDTLAPNLDLASLSSSQLALTGDALVVNPATSLSGQYAQPTGPLFGNSYLAVLANPGPAGTATFNLASNQHEFGFTWGTIDGYNNVTVTTTNGSFTLTGNDIVNNIAGVAIGGQEDVIFNSAANILSATFSSSQNSFEAADFESAVPLPAALPLFASALIGAVALARRRKTA